MDDYVVAFGVFYAISYVVALVLTFALSGLLDMSVPSLGGLFWRNGVLALGATLGLAAAYALPIPFGTLLLPAIGLTIVLALLYDMNPVEEWQMILAFVVAFSLSLFAVEVLMLIAIGPPAETG